MKKIKSQFKLLKKPNLIYFDNAASTLKPSVVIKAVSNYYKNLNANTGRGIYKLAYNVTEKVEQTRQLVAKFLSVNKDEIIFTKNTTESINMVAQSYARYNLQENDEIVISIAEHHSNYLPWLEIAKITKAKVVFIKPHKNNLITLNNFKKALTNKTKIVALTLVSNVVGTITPIKEITALAHKIGAVVLVDAAQAVSHLKVNVSELGCDFLAFSGYKMFAPSGVGVLWGKKELLNTMQPIYFGGGMVQDVHENFATYKATPEKFEAGTPPIASIIGLGEAVKFINKIGYDYITKRDKLLTKYLIEKLNKISGVEIYNENADVPIIAFNILGVHAHDAATIYDQLGVCIRAGHHCAKPLVNHLQQIATLRASLAFYNTTKEIDKFVKKTIQVVQFFNRSCK